jgi:hypothetical protein
MVWGLKMRQAIRTCMDAELGGGECSTSQRPRWYHTMCRLDIGTWTPYAYLICGCVRLRRQFVKFSAYLRGRSQGLSLHFLGQKKYGIYNASEGFH